MAIFTNTQYVAEEVEVYDDVNPTLEGATEILYEFSSDMYKLVGATYVADIMIENAVTEGATDVEALVEGTMSDFRKKASARLKELRAKIAAWFKKVIDKIKLFFTGSKNLIAKYKTQIVDNFGKMKDEDKSYQGYDYMDLDEIDAAHSKAVDEIKGVFEFINKNEPTSEELDKKFVEAVQKAAGDDKVEDVAALKDSFKLKLRGGKTESEKVVIADINKLIKVLASGDAVINKIKSYAGLVDSMIKRAISEIEKPEKADKDATPVTTKATVYNKLITAITGLTTTAVEVIQAANNDYFKVLKKVAGYTEKAKKENKPETPASESASSIFESALGLV